jgi:hypothetical protein
VYEQAKPRMAYRSVTLVPVPTTAAAPCAMRSAVNDAAALRSTPPGGIASARNSCAPASRAAPSSSPGTGTPGRPVAETCNTCTSPADSAARMAVAKGTIRTRASPARTPSTAANTARNSPSWAGVPPPPVTGDAMATTIRGDPGTGPCPPHVVQGPGRPYPAVQRLARQGPRCVQRTPPPPPGHLTGILGARPRTSGNRSDAGVVLARLHGYDTCRLVVCYD